ncbi:hypothetical protein PR048_032872 [Dryococelus australis]|uniref:Uncharacterized protein n=1 Tax=Dryococelus australis TaxID=614101 RepID=A0ABQ9G3F8_9NEOP|nr:hypothetical protein PR048_032872 [Dryococelus australis]
MRHRAIVCPDFSPKQEKLKIIEVEESGDEKGSSTLSGQCQKGSVLIQALQVKLTMSSMTLIVDHKDMKNLKENYSFNNEVLDQPVICGNITRISKSSSHVRELKMNIHLTDLVNIDDPTDPLASIADLWKLEVLVISDPKEYFKRSDEEVIVLDHFRRNL